MIDPRWRIVLTVTPYLVLAALVTFALGGAHDDGSRLLPTVALCATAALWILVFRDLRMPWRDRPVALAVFMSGFILLNLVLVLYQSWFGFLTIATFMFAYSIVPWPWELLAVAATATVAGLAQSYGVGTDETFLVVIVIAVNIVVMCGLSWGLHLAQRQLARVATEVERSRLAREIHDTLAQSFVGIVTQLQAAEQAPGEAARRRHTEAALDLARDGLAEARRSVRALRPVALDAVRLPEALRNVARGWSARTGIPIDVTTSGEDRALSTDVEVALLRTAQEALANVERHADAHRVVLTLCAARSRSRLEVRLEVRDDGRGFDPASGPRDAAREGGGFGLVAMRERLEAVAGSLVVESSPGHGTAVCAEVPA